MDDDQWSKGQVVTGTIWALVLALILAAWVTGLAGHQIMAGLLGFTASALSAVAAVAHIRLYVARVCAELRVIRVDAGPTNKSEASLHRL